MVKLVKWFFVKKASKMDNVLRNHG